MREEKGQEVGKKKGRRRRGRRKVSKKFGFWLPIHDLGWLDT